MNGAGCGTPDDGRLPIDQIDPETLMWRILQHQKRLGA
jgi:hypothetical protein